MVELVVFLFLEIIEWTVYLMETIAKLSWIVMKTAVIEGTIGTIDLAVLTVLPFIFIACKIRHTPTPKVVSNRYGIIYPTWKDASASWDSCTEPSPDR